MNYNSVDDVINSEGFVPLEKSTSKEDGLEAIRQIRNTILIESDIKLLPDYPLTEEKKNEWKIYRNKLRDITKDLDTSNFMLFLTNDGLSVYKDNFSWPEQPSP